MNRRIRRKIEKRERIRQTYLVMARSFFAARCPAKYAKLVFMERRWARARLAPRGRR